MRLTKEQRQIIKESVKCEFGENASVWLFGSRVDDFQRGGDIDLYVKLQNKVDDVLQTEMRLYALLIEKLGDQKIDIVVHSVNSPDKPIYQQAIENGIRL